MARAIDGDELLGIERLLDTDVVRQSKTASWLLDQVLHDIQASPTIDPETLPIVRQLREELARVTAERDAAVKDRAELADFELTVCEQFCLGDREHNIDPCAWLIDGLCKLREWRGPRKEE